MDLSGEVLQGLLEAAPDALIAVDAAGTIVFANERAEKVFGWTRAELVGGPVERLVPGRFASHHPDLRSSYLASPTARPMGAATELWARRVDGSEIPVEISLSAIDTDRGMLVAAAIRDVTATRLAAKKLRQLLASSADALVGVGPDGRIELLNEQAEILFGWDADELIGQPIEVLVPQAAIASHEHYRASYEHDPVMRSMGKGAAMSARRHDGSEFPAEIRIGTIEPEVGSPMALATVRDITERLALERERRERALAEQQEQSHRLESIGQLAGGVAHDFNNLLGVILNYATLAERGTQDDAVIADVRQIRTAAERAADLTRQLLAFARRDENHPVVAALADLVVDLGQLLARTLGERIELDVTVDGAPRVMADPRQLEHILLNLCLNARDALPGGGRIEVEVSLVDLDGSTAEGMGLAAGSMARLRVRDNGSGMPPHVVDRAFEPFFTTKAPGEGTGLGLATVYGAVHQNGGGIELDSTVGIGTTVDIYLPATDREVAAPSRARPTPQGGSERVLVVEDEVRLRAVVARMLEERGYEVVAAASPAEAIERFGAPDGHFDLVLTDVVMPQMSGPAMVEELHRRYGTHAVRVVFMSGYAATESGLGATPVLGKPFSEDQLLVAVREKLNEKGGGRGGTP